MAEISKTKQLLWEKLKDDIQDLPSNLQKFLRKWFEVGKIVEEDLISEIENIDEQIEILEKFYDLADKLGIKIETIESTLKKEAK